MLTTASLINLIIEDERIFENREILKRKHWMSKYVYFKKNCCLTGSYFEGDMLFNGNAQILHRTVKTKKFLKGEKLEIIAFAQNFEDYDDDYAFENVKVIMPYGFLDGKQYYFSINESVINRDESFVEYKRHLMLEIL
jgi:hypothetical protein